MSFVHAPVFMQDAICLKDEIIRLRRMIHENPELGNEEFQTSELISKTLESLDIEVMRPMGTSVVGLLRGGHSGKTVAIRADMDALPVQETTDLSFKSKVEGKMHACGHDVHVAGLLGAAMILSAHREKIHGNVKFLFQPDEEDNGGAQRMINAGCMQDPKVDAVFGAHTDPELPAGTIGLKYGKAYAASDVFSVTITGAGSHGASPHEGVDPIAIGAQVITALQQIVSRRTSPTDSAVVTIGSFHSGTAGNIIPQKAELKGIMRTLGPEMRIKTRKLLSDTVSGICAAMGASAEINIRESYPGVVNHDSMVDLVKIAAEAAIGAENIRIVEYPTMGTEDFGYFIQDVPGAFYKIGVANPETNFCHPLHSPNFCPDESCIPVLAAVHACIAVEYLNR